MADDLVLLAGGGSGGHVFPGLAVGEQLRARGWRIAWVGRPEGMERDLVESHGLEYHALPAAAMVGQGWVAKGTAMLKLSLSALKARNLIVKANAKVVLGTGGYVSAPAVLGARLAGRSAVLFEPNVAAGAANRWLSRWARAAALAHEETAGSLRCPTRLTGTPVRDQFFETRPEPRDELSILILGGSQGARQLNEIFPPALAGLIPRFPRLQVVHQVGERWVDEARAAYRAHGLIGERFEVRAFLDDVANQMRRCHLVVSRAGAITLAEICAAARPALLIPLSVAGGHQGTNAARLVDAGGARVLENPGAASLETELGDLLADIDRLDLMGSKLCHLAHADAAARITDLVLEVAA